MGDLFDELEEKESEAVGLEVSRGGGDLFDEIETKAAPRPAPSVDMEAERLKNREALNAEYGPVDSALVAAGRGMTTIGRAFGLAEPEHPVTTKAFGHLEEKHPVATTVGEIGGEAAPFLLPGAFVSAIPRIGARIAASGLLGAVEGGAIIEGKGGSFEEVATGAGVGGAVAGTAEVVLPVLGRLVSKVFRRITGKQPDGPLLTSSGQPTPEFQHVLEQAGTSFDELTDEAITFVSNQQRKSNPEQLARSARFKSQGIPATAGDISQDFSKQAEESRLASMAGAKHGEMLRQFRLNQSEIFQKKVGEFGDSLGTPGDAGDSVKSALSGRKELLTKEKNALYQQAFETSPEVKRVPVVIDSINAALPEKEILEDLSITAPEAVEQVKLAMARFGIDQSEEAAKLLEKRGLEAQPLTLGNMERFRKTMNAIDRADTTHASKEMTGPIVRALDEEVGLLDEALTASGVQVDESLIGVLKEARATTRQIKTEFSPASIVGKLIDKKKDGVTSVIEASKITGELLRKGAPIENLRSTLNSLAKSGEKGRKAIGDIQASVVLNALEAGLKAPSQKTSGIQTIGGNQFAKYLDQTIGKEKLELLFKGNNSALNSLRSFTATAKDITPTAGAMPKGSAPVILDALNRFGRQWGAAHVVALANFILKAGADERAVARALKAKPDKVKALKKISNDLPQLAAALGISGVLQSLEDE